MSEQTSDVLKHQLEEFRAFRHALSAESDRGCALFAAAYLDTAFEQLMRASLVEDKKVDDDLLDGTAPLSTFSARIKLAYYLGIISAACRADLDAIRKIRNDFAHDASVITFETQSIAARCRNLGYSYHEATARPRAHFTASASRILGILHRLTVSANRPTEKPDDRPSEAEKLANRERVAAAAAAAPSTPSKSGNVAGDA